MRLLHQQDGGWTEAEASDVLSFSVKELATRIEWLSTSGRDADPAP